MSSNNNNLRVSVAHDRPNKLSGDEVMLRVDSVTE